MVSVVSTKYKTTMSSFQSCRVPQAPSAQHMQKLQVFSLRKSRSAQFCFESQPGTAEEFRRAFHRILALHFPSSTKLWQAGDLYQSLQQRSLGAESAFLLVWPGLARHCWDHHVYVSQPKQLLVLNKKKKRRAVVCSDYPFKKDPRFISEVVFKRMTMAKNHYW